MQIKHLLLFLPTFIMLISAPTALGLSSGVVKSSNFIVTDKYCDYSSQCGTGQYCNSAFDCASCPGSTTACSTWQSGGGCGLAYYAAGTSCGSGMFCDGTGGCVSTVPKCQPPSLACMSTQCSPTQCNDGGVCVNSGTVSNADRNYVCISGTWTSIHGSDSACTAAGGNRARVGEPASSTLSQLGAATKLTEGEYKCARPGDSFYFRTRECTPGTCTSDPNDKAICDKASDCIYNGKCYSDIDEAAPKAGITKGALWTSGQWNAEVSTDVNSNPLTAEVCDPGEWHGDPSGTLEGTVANITTVLSGVTVTVLGSGLSDVTDATGYYEISDVPDGTYDITAQHPDPSYQTALVAGLNVPAFSTTTKDITLVHPSENCNDDCTMADGLCHAECNGKGLCSFPTQQTQTTCDQAAPGLVQDPNNPGQQILCCTGASFTPTKATVEVCGDNVVSIKKPVLFKGKLVNMVVTVFDSASCNK